jgi:hypothetical protein
MPFRCLSSVEILEKVGLLLTSASQQHSIRDDKEAGSEVGKVGLNPLLTFCGNSLLEIPSKGNLPDRISQHVIA